MGGQVGMTDSIGRLGYVAAIAVICFLVTQPPPSLAATLPFTQGFIGSLQQYRVRDNESLVEIARKFDLGFNSIIAANPGIDPIVPQSGALLTIPTAWILPDVTFRPAIVINLSEFRLYYFPNKKKSTVVTFPIGIGDQGKDTPVGSFSVIEKILHPAWHVPDSIRAQAPGLPKVIPPGPDNPMGSRALRLSLSSVLIHGTNRPWAIGRRASHGCLRLYPEDILLLYELVPKGMRVIIVDTPIKVGARGKSVFVEVHDSAQEDVSIGHAMHLLADKDLLKGVDFAKLISAVQEKKGIPVDVSLPQ
jgi:L,D-transpeptidase ErfK/SrfK